MPSRPRRLCPTRWLALVLTAVLAACGGGGGGSSPAPANCTVADQQDWLARYMNDWYFWYRQAPHPDPAAYADVAGYFGALLYTGGDAVFPADRWSRVESTVSFDRFFSAGSALGWGVSVAGLEVGGDAAQPLYVRHVEPLSPAAAQGVQRGDQVLAVNGRTAAELIAADDFSALTTDRAGQTLTLALRRGGVDRTVIVGAAVFALTPVTGATVLDAARGRKLGYVVVKDMIAQALGPLDTAFSSFKAAGVNDLVLDLSYNGGGLVSTGATLASYLAGVRGSGHRYARLLYNDKRAAANDQNIAFSQPAASLGLPRVIVLAGRRTCSASEQVVNGLRGAGVEVLLVGEASCGKPVGFVPTSACGQTYSVVNFESVNDLGEGRYFDGLAALCEVAEDFTAAQGGSTDPLLAAARYLADNDRCPPAVVARAQRQGAGGAARVSRSDERQSMLAR
jgi:hypothetical protein